MWTSPMGWGPNPASASIRPGSDRCVGPRRHAPGPGDPSGHTGHMSISAEFQPRSGIGCGDQARLGRRWGIFWDSWQFLVVSIQGTRPPRGCFPVGSKVLYAATQGSSIIRNQFWGRLIGVSLPAVPDAA